MAETKHITVKSMVGARTGQGLRHRPAGPPRPQPRYDRATLALLCTQADDLTARLRRRYLRVPVAGTERVLRCYGRTVQALVTRL